MAIDAVKTSWGISVTCTGGTAAATQISTTPTEIIQIQGISMTGAATTDIVTVQDGAGRQIWRGVAQNTSGTTSIMFPQSIRVEGLKVGVAGATTGWCQIFMA